MTNGCLPHSLLSSSKYENVISSVAKKRSSLFSGGLLSMLIVVWHCKWNCIVFVSFFCKCIIHYTTPAQWQLNRSLYQSNDFIGTRLVEPVSTEFLVKLIG